MSGLLRIIAVFVALGVSILFAAPPQKGGEKKGERKSHTGKVTTVPTPEGGRASMAQLDASGAVHLVFQTHDGPKYAKSTDGGRHFSKSIPIVDRESRKPGLEFEAWDLAVSPQGHVHVALGTNAWKLKLPQDQWGFFYASLEPDATLFSPVRNINHTPSEGFSLAADNHGNVAACWLKDKLFTAISNDGGKTFSEGKELDPAYNPCNCCTTSCAYGADGKVAILYREETNNMRDMYLVLWDASNNSSTRVRIGSTSWKIPDCPMTYYKVVQQGRGYLAAWPTEGKIYFASLLSDGKPASPPEVQTVGHSGMRSGIFALQGAEGFLVGWKKDGQLGWETFDGHFKPAGQPGSVHSDGKGAAGIVDKMGHYVLFQ